MSYHVYFLPKKNKVDKRGTLPIYCRISLSANDRAEYYTQIRIHQQFWLDKPIPNRDGTIRYIKGSSLLINAYNKKLNLISAKILERYNEALKNGEPISARELKKALTGEVSKTTLSYLFEEVAKTKGSESTKKTFESRCRKILTFVQSEYENDLPVTALTHDKYRAFPIRFETWLDSQGSAKNYKQVLFSTLNDSYKHAIKSGYVARGKNPFDGYELNDKGRTKGRVPLNFEELIKFEKVVLKDIKHQRVRDFFIFQALTGYSYVDLKQASKENLVIDANGKTWILKNRQKTDGASKVPLIDKAQAILNKHKSEDRKTLFKIPYPNEYNTSIREIAAKAGIDKHLTSHSARHSCATLLLEIGIPMKTISLILGHSNTKTTEHYAKVTDPLVAEQFEKLNKKLGS